MNVVRESRGQWQVKRAGEQGRLAVAKDKSQAIRTAREYSRKTNAELVIHEKSRRIVARHVTAPATAAEIKSTLRKAYARPSSR